MESMLLTIGPWTLKEVESETFDLRYEEIQEGEPTAEKIATRAFRRIGAEELDQLRALLKAWHIVDRTAQ